MRAQHDHGATRRGHATGMRNTTTGPRDGDAQHDPHGATPHATPTQDPGDGTRGGRPSPVGGASCEGRPPLVPSPWLKGLEEGLESILGSSSPRWLKSILDSLHFNALRVSSECDGTSGWEAMGSLPGSVPRFLGVDPGSSRPTRMAARTATRRATRHGRRTDDGRKTEDGRHALDSDTESDPESDSESDRESATRTGSDRESAGETAE
jgi:hypothetical protein